MAEAAGDGGTFASAGGKRSPREWVLRVALMLAGLTVAHSGVTLFILPGLGSDPFTLFAQGCARQLGVSIGTTHAGIQVIFLIVMVLTTKGYVLPGTVVCSFFGGPIIDLFSWLLGGFISPASPMPLRIASTLAGCVILAAGMALVIKSRAGTGANDLVAVILTDKLRRFQFRWVRLTVDAFFAVCGVLLGGVFGLGTLASCVIVGPVAQFFFPVMERLVGVSVARFASTRDGARPL